MQINRINEENNDLILSEREAWVSLSYTVLLVSCFLPDTCLFILPQCDRSRKVSELAV